MELLLLLLAGGVAGAAVLMPEAEAEEIPEFDEDDPDRPHYMDEPSAGSGSDPEVSYVEDQELHDMTKLAFARWEASPRGELDLSLLENPPEGVEDRSYEGSERGEYKRLDREGLRPVEGEGGPDDPWIMNVEGKGGDDEFYIALYPDQIARDHAYAIYGGDGDDKIRGQSVPGSFSNYGSDVSSNGVVYGGAGDDLLGFDAAEYYGGSGDDRIFAGGNNAWYFGEEGNDQFYLGRSIEERGDWDVLPEVYGGSGEDKFQLSPFAAATDRISAVYDFEVGMDKIYFNSFDVESLIINEVEDGTELIFYNAHKDFDEVIWLNGVRDFHTDDVIYGPVQQHDTRLYSERSK